MKVPLFRARDKDSDNYYIGFYFMYPQTTYCVATDYDNNKVKIIHCLMTYRMTDWGLANQPLLVTIDKNTLEQIGEVETTETFYTPGRY